MDMDSNSDVAMRGRCRVCLEKDVDVVALSLTVCVFAEEVTLFQMLNTCCAVEISATDLKPQHACNHCAKMAEQSFIFRKTCQKADITLDEELDGVNIKVEPDKLTTKEDQKQVVGRDEIKIESDELIIKEDHEEDDHKKAIMAPIKDEFRDYVLLSNTDDLTHLHSKQNTCSTEQIVCKICQTNFTDWISLEHHLENCYSDVCGVCGQTFTSADAHYEHTQMHENPSIDKTVILKREESKRHKCRFCKMSYKYPAELRNHVMTHTTVEHYLCLYCKNKFSLAHRSKCERTKTQHSRKHINKERNNRAGHSSQTQRRLGCSVCQKPYRRRETLINHKCIKASKKPHKCSQCSKEFAFSSLLRRHTIVAHSGEKPYECSHCRKRFNTQSSIARHKRIHSGEKPHECSSCNKRFTHRGSLVRHILNHTGEKPFKCSQCSKGFPDLYNLNRHELTHTGEKPFGCSQCSKRFTQRGALNRHILTHTGEKPYECSHCRKGFSRHADLTVHERFHTGDKPYKCSHCSRCFTTQTRLTMHERTHTGEKPYECLHCSKCFTTLSSLKSHKRIHTGEKPFECLHCSKRFTRLSNLISHKRIHSGQKPYECLHCSKCFTRKGDLKSHERTHTGEKPF